VVVAGRGVKTPEGFNLVREMGMVLGGEVGATGLSSMAHWGVTRSAHRADRQVDQAEAADHLRDLRAIQYTAAIRGTGTIVAVNRDPRRPIFKMADIGVVTDAPSFLPAFLASKKPPVPGDHRSLS